MSKLETIADFLRAHSTLTLATISDNGTPYATPLFYIAGEDLRLYWLSSASSAHSLHVRACACVSVAVYDETDEWKKICGVQMWGNAGPMEEETGRKKIIKIYAERFHLGSLFRLTIRACAVYCFRPMRVRYLNNSRRFGFRHEIVLPESGSSA